jgi:hypothetical protein
VTDTDPMQMLFEIHGLILSLHHDARFLRSAGAVDRARVAFERVVQYYAQGAPHSLFPNAAPTGAAACLTPRSPLIDQVFLV